MLLDCASAERDPAWNMFEPWQKFFEHGVCSSNNTQYAKTHRSDAVLPISYNPVPFLGDDRTIRKIGLTCQMTITVKFNPKTCQVNV